jgi:renalase
MDVDVIVVGAGVCGLSLAHGLQDARRQVVVLDKGSTPGGRLGSRRVRGALVDTGAPSTTVRDAATVDEVRRRVGDLVTATPTESAHAQAPGWHLRWASSARQVAARWAEGIDVRRARVERLERTNRGWRAVTDDGERSVTGARVVLTAPTPQSVDLLAASGLRSPDACLDVAYEPRFVLLAQLAGSLEFSNSGRDVLHLTHRAPATDGLVAVALEATAAWSATSWDDDDDLVRRALLDELQHICPDGRIEQSELKRWRYANATATATAPFVTAPEHAGDDGVVIGGDGFGALTSSGLERAVQSGLAISAHLLGTPAGAAGSPDATG